IYSFRQCEKGTRHTLYSTVMVPELALLDLRQDCRIFQNLSVPDIIQQVFDAAGMSSYQLQLQGSYEPRVYCVQYRETDLNFVRRLMEDEGIYYFFEHGESASTLTLIDDPAGHKSLPGGSSLEHHDTGGGTAPKHSIYGIKWQESMTTNAVTLRDFDFERPSVDHLHLDTTVDQCMRLEQYDYPGIYTEAGLGGKRVQHRIDGLQASRRTIEASTNARHLLPGYRFNLEQHPNNRFNREFTITRLGLKGYSPQSLEQDQGSSNPSFSCEFHAVPADTVLRSPHTAHRPRVDGVQTAIVVGPSGEEIYTDEYGRVKVQFHWDRVGAYNEKSSCWVRVSQLWAGAGWGGMDIPRIGHEVIVSFEEGDPDRPLITGRVYHAQNRPPHTLPANKVKSTIRSNSTPGGGGFNELTFDDTKGNEEVYLHSQHNTSVETLNDKRQATGRDELLTIGRHREKHVGQHETIQIGGMKNELIAATCTQTVGLAKALTIGAAYQISVGAAMNRTVALNKSEQVGQNSTIGVAKEFVVNAGDMIHLETGDSALTMRSDGTVDLHCKKFNVNASSSVTIKANKITEN
ncbi:MAG: type VI secretion system tip protein TssI/VgrG, partial [Pseudomonadota bacterium]